MLRIRLSRVGKRKQPSYRLVVADSRAPRDGAFVEIIGHYNPCTDPLTLVVKEERAVDWLRKGAQPSDTAAKLLTRIGIMEQAGRESVVWDGTTKVPSKKKEAEAPRPAPAAPVAAAPVAEASAAEAEPPEAVAEPAEAPAAEAETPEAVAEPAEAPAAEAEQPEAVAEPDEAPASEAETPEAVAEPAETPAAEAGAEATKAEAAPEKRKRAR